MSDPTRWPARRSRGGESALWVAGGLLFVAVAALVFGGSREPGLGMVLLALLAALLAAVGTFLLIWSIGYRRLAYLLTDSALRIDWLGKTTVVPYAAIQGIYTGQRLAGHATPGAPRWPGINVGAARVRGLGRLRFFATSADQGQLMLITIEHGGVIVSARDAQAFRAALIERVEVSGETGVDQRVIYQAAPTLAPWTALLDPWLVIWMALGAVALLVVLALITARFDALADPILLRFDAGGKPNQLAAKSDLLRLPLFGLICLVVNWVVGVWVHPREKVLARLLWVGGAIVQLVLLVAVPRLVA